MIVAKGIIGIVVAVVATIGGLYLYSVWRVSQLVDDGIAGMTKPMYMCQKLDGIRQTDSVSAECEASETKCEDRKAYCGYNTKEMCENTDPGSRQLCTWDDSKKTCTPSVLKDPVWVTVGQKGAESKCNQLNNQKLCDASTDCSWYWPDCTTCIQDSNGKTEFLKKNPQYQVSGSSSDNSSNAASSPIVEPSAKSTPSSPATTDDTKLKKADPVQTAASGEPSAKPTPSPGSAATTDDPKSNKAGAGQTATSAPPKTGGVIVNQSNTHLDSVQSYFFE